MTRRPGIRPLTAPTPTVSILSTGGKAWNLLALEARPDTTRRPSPASHHEKGRYEAGFGIRCRTRTDNRPLTDERLGRGAGPPVRKFLPSGDFTFDRVCAFPVGIHMVANNDYTITFFDSQGNRPSW